MKINFKFEICIFSKNIAQKSIPIETSSTILKKIIIKDNSMNFVYVVYSIFRLHSLFTFHMKYQIFPYIT